MDTYIDLLRCVAEVQRSFCLLLKAQKQIIEAHYYQWNLEKYPKAFYQREDFELSLLKTLSGVVESQQGLVQMVHIGIRISSAENSLEAHPYVKQEAVAMRTVQHTLTTTMQLQHAQSMLNKEHITVLKQLYQITESLLRLLRESQHRNRALYQPSAPFIATYIKRKE